METYDMAGLGSELGLPEQLFLTRTKGAQAYRLLKDRLAQLSEDQGLLLVFPKDQLIDASFADETFIRLGEELANDQTGNVTLVLQGLSQDSIENIEAMISLRRLKLAFLAVDETGGWQCIGHLDPALKEVLYLLAERDHLTAPQLANLLTLAANTASTRLKRLYDRRLIRRQSKGPKFYYQFWQWSQEPSMVQA